MSDNEYEENMDEDYEDVVENANSPKETNTTEHNVSDEAPSDVSASLKEFHKDPSNESENKDDAKNFRFYLQHGAHRAYGVPEKYILHTATKLFEVRDGEHLGDILSSCAAGKWSFLTYQHVTIVGGKAKNSEVFEEAPYICFDTPASDTDATTDDPRWLRPIPSAIYNHCRDKWRKQITTKYQNDEEKRKRILSKYKRVLSWKEELLAGPTLNPERLGVGDDDFTLLARKLKSIRVKPGVVPRNTKPTNSSDGKSKVVSPIDKSKQKKKFTGGGIEEDFPCPQAWTSRTVCLGLDNSVHTFVKDGKVFATYMNEPCD